MGDVTACGRILKTVSNAVKFTTTGAWVRDQVLDRARALQGFGKCRRQSIAQRPGDDLRALYQSEGNTTSSPVRPACDAAPDALMKA